MNALNAVRGLDFLSAPELLLCQWGHSVPHLGDQVEDKAEIGLCYLPMCDFRGDFESREVQQRCDLLLEQSAASAILSMKLEPSEFCTLICSNQSSDLLKQGLEKFHRHSRRGRRLKLHKRLTLIANHHPKYSHGPRQFKALFRAITACFSGVGKSISSSLALRS
jgi:hypothetical protein